MTMKYIEVTHDPIIKTRNTEVRYTFKANQEGADCKVTVIMRGNKVVNTETMTIKKT